MDAQENPFTQIYSASCRSGTRTCCFLLMSTRRLPHRRQAHWNSLPADVRKVLEDTAKETQAFVYDYASKDDTALLGKLKQGRHAGQRCRPGRVRRGEQADLRGIRQGSPGREGSDRPRCFAAPVAPRAVPRPNKSLPEGRREAPREPSVCATGRPKARTSPSRRDGAQRQGSPRERRRAAPRREPVPPWRDRPLHGCGGARRGRSSSWSWRSPPK